VHREKPFKRFSPREVQKTPGSSRGVTESFRKTGS
jgi:hypothetical protein